MLGGIMFSSSRFDNNKNQSELETLTWIVMTIITVAMAPSMLKVRARSWLKSSVNTIIANTASSPCVANWLLAMSMSLRSIFRGGTDGKCHSAGRAKQIKHKKPQKMVLNLSVYYV